MESDYDNVPSLDKLMEIDTVGREKDPVIAKILVDNLKSDIPSDLRNTLFGFTNSRVFLSKIDSATNEKRIIWELMKLAELDYLTSIPKSELNTELDNTLSQITFEVMLGLNLSDDGLGFKGFSEAFKFHEVRSGRDEMGPMKKPPIYSPRRWLGRG